MSQAPSAALAPAHVIEQKKRRSSLTGRYDHKLTPEQAAVARELRASGVSVRRIARDLGVHHATISRATKTSPSP